ncbi:MAG TPA: DUF5668 domain-containing protein [Atribacterota bacterium]|nr:DUF5668 domain-containing protein [Atribacterota bacterium]
MKTQRKNFGQWLVGIIILLIGIVFLIENFYGIEIWENVWLFWPVIFILWGLVELLPRKSIFFGLILLAIGIIFLLKNLELYQWPDYIWKYWPVIIIALGIDQLMLGPESVSTKPIQTSGKVTKKMLVQDDEII